MKLFNTLTRTTDDLRPLEDNKIKLYTCGLTVYSQPHIGNWLGYIYWDVLVRSLRASGFEVVRTQNITDVGHLTSDDDSGEDKMEKGARKEGITAWDVAEKYIEIADHEAYEVLGLIRPEHLVRAIDMIDEQIAFAQTLDDRGYLYKIEDDGMYFDTSKLTDYGRLARLDIDGLEAGARVPIDGKRNITDFAVWKFSHPGQKRDMEWESPWGVGFPGWHLECSVIARETLGDQIDIHAGGIDHIPVHHINEIAQTEAVTGKQFSQFWLHNNHIKVDGTKISKSLGNVYTLQDITDKGFSIEAYKMLALGKHYRTEGNFTWEILEAAANRLKRWQSIADRRWQVHSSDATPDILVHLQNDLDTPQALAEIDRYFDNVLVEHLSPSQVSLEQIARLLGINLLGDDITPDLKQHIAARQQARTDKDWATSDQIRDELLAEGIGLNDTQDGVTWYRL
jgi:cysteinyl-tRNA synthetase